MITRLFTLSLLAFLASSAFAQTSAPGLWTFIDRDDIIFADAVDFDMGTVARKGDKIEILFTTYRNLAIESSTAPLLRAQTVDGRAFKIICEDPANAMLKYEITVYNDLSVGVFAINQDSQPRYVGKATMTTFSKAGDIRDAISLSIPAKVVDLATPKRVVFQFESYRAINGKLRLCDHMGDLRLPMLF